MSAGNEALMQAVGPQFYLPLIIAAFAAVGIVYWTMKDSSR